ncbi:hypothetical protein SKUN_001751 (plasmid) [Spiroplasma kunkelii CR2-3x]|uniref:Uncharacterized protein n=1 Tax=Spiroplasma kunkelii CR2-3x TaxID=273035 RepID=A0A0K2JJI5_SPIKU|nr:hypothetical protein [Spiroplasma kunkelii]ALA98602.1 hypothetical protein SKUN_001751 [Spiroplasma kunkelii CR2-3x]
MTYNTVNIIDFIDKFFENKKENSNVQNKEHINNLKIKVQWDSGKMTYIEKL